MNRIPLTILFFLLCLPRVEAAEVAIADEMDRINYSLGYQIGSDLKEQDVDIREQLLLQGIQDARGGQPPQMTKAEMRAVLVELKQRVVKAAQDRREAYLAEGRAFLAENGQKEGVHELPSGLQYEVLTAGTGPQPGKDSQVRVNYRAWTLEGQEFDSSYRDGQPAEFGLDQVIPGWREAIPLMGEGARWKLYLPPDLAFGERGPLADQVVIYELELVKVLD